MKRVVIILTAMVLIVANKGLAQSTDIVVSNLYAIQDTEDNPLSPEAVINVWHVGFTINDPALAAKVFFELGSTAEGSDVRQVEVMVTENDGKYVLTYNDIVYEINEGAAHIDFRLSEAENMNVAFATVYVQDKTGKTTEKVSLAVGE